MYDLTYFEKTSIILMQMGINGLVNPNKSLKYSHSIILHFEIILRRFYFTIWDNVCDLLKCAHTV